MRNIKLTKNPYILFLPFLILYIIIVFVFPTDGKHGDEGHYLSYAESLLAFHFNEPLFSGGRIPSGPGYPIILIPFVLFKLPLYCITILNSIFLYLSIVLMYKTLQMLLTQRIAVIVSIFWALYFHSYVYLNKIYTEVFAIFLIALLIFNILMTFNSFEDKKIKKHLLISGLTLGFLALTKVIFGYVILVLLLSSIILWIKNKKSVNYFRMLMILLLSIGLTIPYLTYTYYHTGKIFYWATTGGNNLYWLSTPYEGEYGSWQSFDKLKQVSTIEHSGVYEYNDSIISNHIKVYDEIANYNIVQQDDKLKDIAINNIKIHPIKFLQNWISNVGRILFNYPYSYSFQTESKLVYFPLNGIICVLLLFSIIPTYLNWNKINFGIRFLILFALVYLGGSTFGSAEIRMFTIIAPVLLLWIAYILHNVIIINLKFNRLPSSTNENFQKKE